jgi:hypothetical protein
MSPQVGRAAPGDYASLTMRAALVALSLGLTGCLDVPPPAPTPGPGAVPGTAGTPGEPHVALAELAGDWRVTVTTPGQEQPLGGGTATLESLHQGRFLRLTVDLTLGAQPVSLTGHLGYDRGSGEWQALWLSDLSTGMSLLRGTGELARGVSLAGVRGGLRGRSVLTVHGPNRFRVETFGPGGDGRERLLRRSDYVRR